MARQKQWHKNATYTVIGPAGRQRNVKYIHRFTVGEDEVIVFRFMRMVVRARKKRARKTAA